MADFLQVVPGQLEGLIQSSDGGGDGSFFPKPLGQRKSTGVTSRTCATGSDSP